MKGLPRRKGHLTLMPGRGRCITFDDEHGSNFTGSDFSGVCCSGYAWAIRRMLGGRVRIFGFYTWQNPGTLIEHLHDGHDFAVVDGRFIVDPWLVEVEDPDGAFTSPRVAARGDAARGDAARGDAEGPVPRVDRGVFDLDDPADADVIRHVYGDRARWKPMIEMEQLADAS